METIKATSSPIGLIAGNGNFPLLFAKEALKQKVQVVAIGVQGETEPELESLVKHFYWIKLGQLSKLIRCFKAEDVQQAVMIGQVKHMNIFKQLSLDLKAFSLLATLKDKKADTILGGVVKLLEKEGIQVLPSTTFLSHLLPSEGVITKSSPTKSQKRDILFGTKIAREIAGLDIGQTVVVKNASVVAVEAMEGTDETIRRAGGICPKGVVVIKVSKPKQDIRFDVPVIGLKTIQMMVEAKASVLAIDAGKCLFFDQEETLSLANEHGICILAQ